MSRTEHERRPREAAKLREALSRIVDLEGELAGTCAELRDAKAEVARLSAELEAVDADRRGLSQHRLLEALPDPDQATADERAAQGRQVSRKPREAAKPPRCTERLSPDAERCELPAGHEGLHVASLGPELGSRCTLTFEWGVVRRRNRRPLAR